MRKLLLFVLIFLTSKTLLGQSQILGGEIYYKQLDSFKYELIAQIYRDCRGVAINSINGSVYADSIKLPLNFRRISIENISENCGTNTCININAPSSAGGIEKHIFKDTIDFTQAPYDTLLKNNFCEITFGVFTQGWNNAIWTINNPNFFIDAMVNICHQKAFIHSPEFSNKPLFQACCNQPLRYNPGILKFEDTDSFSFELAGVLNNYNTNAVYSWNLTKTIPMAPYCPPNPGVVNCRPLPNAIPPRGFYFDPIVNDIVFTSTNCNGGLGVIKFQVKQWKYNTQTQTMEIVGYVNRQTLIETNTCINNNPPYFSSNTNVYDVCAGDSLIINVASKDDNYSPNQNTYDTTHISWSNNLDNASFTYLDSNAREKIAVLKWKASGNPYQITQKYIHLKIVDKQCNVQTSKGVLINVYPKIAFKINSKDIKGCNFYEVSTAFSDSFSLLKNVSYDYKIWYLNNPSKVIKQITKKSDTFHYILSGTYVIRYEINHSFLSCKSIVFDTIYLNHLSVLENRIKDSMVCQNDEIILGNTNMKDSLSTYTWQLPVGKNIVNYNLPYLKIKVNQSKYNLRLIVSNKNCSQSSNALLTTNNGFDLNVYNNDTIACKNKSFKLEMKNINSTPNAQISWSFNNQYIYNPYTYFDYLYSNKTTVKIIQEDNVNCLYERIIDVNLSEIDKFNFNDFKICDNNLSIITADYQIPENYIKKYEWYYNNINLNKDSQSLKYTLKSPANLKLKLFDYYGCNAEKTKNQSFYPTINLKIIGDTNYNYHEYVKLSANQNFKTYFWNNSVQTKNNEFWAKSLGPPGSYPISLQVTDSIGCKGSHQILISTNQFTSIATQDLNHFQIFPNPSDGNITIKSNTKENIEIYSVNGQLMHSQWIEVGTNSLDLSHLNKGVYFVKIAHRHYKLVIG
ncbi:MAG: T9SS type A sorting domain-containing protein [Bacteroidota bacterium]|nr:T9SS type A sorting domain-containing protein [Bacteroidota bacterium]